MVVPRLGATHVHSTVSDPVGNPFFTGCYADRPQLAELPGRDSYAEGPISYAKGPQTCYFGPNSPLEVHFSPPGPDLILEEPPRTHHGGRPPQRIVWLSESRKLIRRQGVDANPGVEAPIGGMRTTLDLKSSSPAPLPTRGGFAGHANDTAMQAA
jgi:hypothetical protein